MRIPAFITDSAGIRHILNHIGVDTDLPRITPARGPPLWDACDAQVGEGGKSSRIGTWPHSQHRTMRWISVSVGKQVQFGCSLTFNRANHATPNTLTSKPHISNAAPTKWMGCNASPNTSQPVLRPTNGTSMEKGAIRLAG